MPGDDLNLHDIAIPSGLSPDGQRAAEIIAAFLKERDLTYTGGCRTFYTPKEWEARREEYGLRSVLIVVYDGGDVGDALSYDHEQYNLVEELSERLAAVGLYAEECTCWYSAIYLR